MGRGSSDVPLRKTAFPANGCFPFEKPSRFATVPIMLSSILCTKVEERKYDYERNILL